MKVLKKYVLVEFLKTLLISSAGLITLLLVIDMVENAGEMLERGATVAECVRVFTLEIPVFAAQILPIAVLLSSFITMALLNKSSEITAVKAGGIGLSKIVAPVLVAGFFISLAVIALNENVVPAAQKEINFIKTKLKKDRYLFFGSQGFWVRSQGAIYNIKNLNLDTSAIDGVTAYLIDKPFSLKDEVMVHRAAWDGEKWIAEKKPKKNAKKGAAPQIDDSGTVALTWLKPPTELIAVSRRLDSFNYSELRRYIRSMEKSGYDTGKYYVELYAKLSFPFVNLVMAFIGIPLAMRTGRNAAVATGVAVSIMIGFSFWVVFGLSKTLGAEGVIPPFMAAWFPVVLFMAIGAYMFEYVRQ